MQLLEVNSARLSPECKQRCKQEWGIEGSPQEVSFMAPLVNEALWDGNTDPSQDAAVPKAELSRPITAHLPEDEAQSLTFMHVSTVARLAGLPKRNNA